MICKADAEQYCQATGWTDPQPDGAGGWWAFPPGAVMPAPIDRMALICVHHQRNQSTYPDPMTAIACRLHDLITGGVFG